MIKAEINRVLNAIKKSADPIAVKLVTHSGIFQLDEIMATCLLMIQFGITIDELQIVLIRTRDKKRLAELKNDPYIVMYDVGEEYDGQQFFDHHQKDFEVKFHDSAIIKMSSFGAVLKHYGPYAFMNLAHVSQTSLMLDEASKMTRKLYDQLGEAIDAIDNGGMVNEIKPKYRCDMRNMSLNAVVDSYRDFIEYGEDEAFIACVEFCFVHLYKMMNNIIKYDKMTKVIDAAVATASQPEIIVYEEYMPDTKQYICEKYPDVLFKVYMDKIQGIYKVDTVTGSTGSFSMRKPLPEMPNELKIKLKSFVFRHNTGFIAGFGDKFEAIEFAKYATL